MMRLLNKCALLCAILALSVLQPIVAKRSFGGGRSHSYPKSGGLSGGGHHYPSSGGLSGGGHGYPSSGGSHGYPSSGGSHGYPSQGGSHSYPSQGSSHSYPSQGGSHGYPASGGLSGSNTHHPSSHGYPASKGLSGNTGGTTNIHHHYHYNPPPKITYTPSYGGAPVSYPVYRGAPPTYVYQYKDSGSKYGTLLAGLALLNLGTLAGTAYAISHSHGHSGSNYKAQPGEVCKFGVKKDNGDYEETRIECQLISSFILAEEAKAQSAANHTTITTTTVTNSSTVNTINGVPEQAKVNQTVSANPLYEMLPNGTLVPVNVTSTNMTANATGHTPGNPVTSSVTVTTSTTNTTTVNALDVKGSPIAVTPGMTCYVIRNSRTSNMRKSIPCGLLQTYADKSLARNSAIRNTPTFTIAAIIVAAFFMN